MSPELHLTLWPSFGHFARFAADERVAGVRLNSAMVTGDSLDRELELARGTRAPVWFDAKGRQLRVLEVLDNPDYLDIRLNHPIKVETPTEVLLKAGADAGLLGSVSEGGHRLTFAANPRYRVRAGESLHIRHPSFEVLGPTFVPAEVDRVERARRSGITRWYLSYVESQRDVDEFREMIGRDAELMLKIESKRGLEYAVGKFHGAPRTNLVAACGDLFVEVSRPHHILPALRAVVDADPLAMVGSRMLLSLVHDEVPSLADLTQIAWLRSLGYGRFLLCDELCLREDALERATAVFRSVVS